MAERRVTEAALLIRVNRVLAKEDRLLTRNREGNQWYEQTGRYYCLNFSTLKLEAQHVDIEEWAKDLCVLRYGEVVERVEPPKPPKGNPRKPAVKKAKAKKTK